MSETQASSGRTLTVPEPVTSRSSVRDRGPSIGGRNLLSLAFATAALSFAMAGCGIVPATATSTMPSRPEAQAHQIAEGLPSSAVALEAGAPAPARRRPEPPTLVGVPVAEAETSLPGLRVPSARWPTQPSGPWSYACALALDPAIDPSSATLAWDRVSLVRARDDAACVVFD